MRWREDGSARALYERSHIPGAAFVDWATDLVDPEARYAFMLAPPERFAAAMERAGIGDGTRVVAYSDERGSGPFRLWWAARVYGYENVAILDGGLERWIAEGRPLSDRPPPSRTEKFLPRPRADLVATAEDVAAAGHEAVRVFDSRPANQFRGSYVWFEAGPIPADADGFARTPRGEIRAGRVPWALNVPVAGLYREDGTMKSPEELRTHFESRGATPDSPAITYCGVGISAAALLFALHRAGFEDLRLYDGSWDEWGRDPTRPVVRG